MLYQCISFYANLNKPPWFDLKIMICKCETFLSKINLSCNNKKYEKNHIVIIEF